MFQQTRVVRLLTFLLFAGELPKELGDLVNLTLLCLDNNMFRGELYVPSYVRTLGYAHNGVWCVIAQ